MNYLIVVAHPDDEVLGAGATMYKLSQEGHHVDVCILSGEVEARNGRPEIEELHQDVESSMSVLGVRTIYKAGFPNIKFNNVNHLELVQFIEKVLVESQADVVFTHHPADTNNDHLHTSLSCQAAIRLFQRNPDVKPIRELLFMEVPSATEWSVNTSMNAFRPNTFVEVGKEAIRKKIYALSLYRGVMRPYPHPRSDEVLEGLAAYRGGQSGMVYAEAFESVFRRGLS
jgi:LmbE family N-acetylglucosaminyl deacetylase